MGIKVCALSSISPAKPSSLDSISATHSYKLLLIAGDRKLLLKVSILFRDGGRLKYNT
jgi:hypothetical protein